MYILSSVFFLFVFTVHTSLRDYGTWGDHRCLSALFGSESQKPFRWLLQLYLYSFTRHVFGNREPWPECLNSSSWRWRLISKVFFYIVLLYLGQNTCKKTTMLSVMFVLWSIRGKSFKKCLFILQGWLELKTTLHQLIPST